MGKLGTAFGQTEWLWLRTLTMQQIFILDIIGRGEIQGPDLRAELERGGFPVSPPGFCETMKRLERAGLVDGRYTKPAKAPGRARAYQLTADGIIAILEARRFFEARKWLAVDETREKNLPRDFRPH